MTIKEIASVLKENNNFEILTHNYPDGDCLGCGCALALALRKLGKNANVVTTDKPKNFDFITSIVEDMDFEPAEGDYQQASAFGKKFASSGGVAGAVLECMKERGEDTSDIKLLKVSSSRICPDLSS